jgi:hypothetical protein
MAQHDVNKYVEALTAAGATEEEIVRKYNLFKHSGVFWAWNRSTENLMIQAAQAVEAKKAREPYDGRAETYQCPYFKKAGHEWVIIARGCDFKEGPYGPVVGVKKRSGEVRFVEVIEAVNTSDTRVRAYRMA